MFSLKFQHRMELSPFNFSRGRSEIRQICPPVVFQGPSGAIGAVLLIDWMREDTLRMCRFED